MKQGGVVSCDSDCNRSSCTQKQRKKTKVDKVKQEEGEARREERGEKDDDIRAGQDADTVGEQVRGERSQMHVVDVE